MYIVELFRYGSGLPGGMSPGIGNDLRAVAKDLLVEADELDRIEAAGFIGDLSEDDHVLLTTMRRTYEQFGQPEQQALLVLLEGGAQESRWHIKVEHPHAEERAYLELSDLRDGWQPRMKAHVAAALFDPRGVHPCSMHARYRLSERTSAQADTATLRGLGWSVREGHQELSAHRTLDTGLLPEERADLHLDWSLTIAGRECTLDGDRLTMSDDALFAPPASSGRLARPRAGVPLV